jgi:hypothetical protein
MPIDRDEIEARLLASIAELDGRSYEYPISGYQIELYLDPETPEVYLFEHVGAGVPMAAWHRRHRWVCSIPDHAIPASVVEVLETYVGHLVALVEAYEGSEWDGSNYVGRWSDMAELDPDCWGRWEFSCYWDPYLWFEGSDREILELAAQGYTPTDILPTLYLGDQYNGEVRPDAALEYVTEVIEEAHGG